MSPIQLTAEIEHVFYSRLVRTEKPPGLHPNPIDRGDAVHVSQADIDRHGTEGAAVYFGHEWTWRVFVTDQWGRERLVEVVPKAVQEAHGRIRLGSSPCWCSEHPSRHHRRFDCLDCGASIVPGCREVGIPPGCGGP